MAQMCGRCQEPLGDAWNSRDHLCTVFHVYDEGMCELCDEYGQKVNSDGYCRDCFQQAQRDDIDIFASGQTSWRMVQEEQLRVAESEAVGKIRRSIDALRDK